MPIGIPGNNITYYQHVCISVRCTQLRNNKLPLYRLPIGKRHTTIVDIYYIPTLF